MGLSNGFVTNDQFTATSQFGADNYAYTARLKLTGIRWCSVNTGTIDYSQYVQVDFRSVVTLTGVATQGDDNHYNNYPKKYYLEISMDGTLYTDVKGMDGNRQVCMFCLHCIILQCYFGVVSVCCYLSSS